MGFDTFEINLVCFIIHLWVASLSIQTKYYFVYDGQWPEDQCILFENDDQGHDYSTTALVTWPW